jgi:hypothetical protein
VAFGLRLHLLLFLDELFDLLDALLGVAGEGRAGLLCLAIVEFGLRVIEENTMSYFRVSFSFLSF